MGNRRSPRPLRRLVLVVAATLAAAAASASGASAATLTTDFPCYFEQKTLTWSAADMAPNADYKQTVDGTEVGSGKTDANGAATGTLTTPKLPRKTGEQRSVLAIAEGTNTAEAPFRVSQFNADFAPSSGDPKTLLVRFSIFGFGARKTIFLHYLRPGVSGTKAVARTVRLGKVKGVCGKIKRTKQRHLFPFDASSGEWRLQFDTRRTYSPGAQPAVVRRVRVAAD
jgi:hypothetical protein